MKSNGGNGRRRHPTFKEKLEAVRAENCGRLAHKARMANHVAKSASGRSRRAAYEVKTAALNQGLRCGGFRLRGDELARPGLALVRMPSHGQLHVPVDRLSRDVMERPEIRVRLRGHAP